MDSLRWRQRFLYFKKAYNNLSEVVYMQDKTFSNLEKEGIIQRFMVLIELSWKVLKDFLEYEGFSIKSPKETIRDAFSFGLISD